MLCVSPPNVEGQKEDVSDIMPEGAGEWLTHEKGRGVPGLEEKMESPNSTKTHTKKKKTPHTESQIARVVKALDM